jgi:hypothetical protein
MPLWPGHGLKSFPVAHEHMGFRQRQAVCLNSLFIISTDEPHKVHSAPGHLVMYTPSREKGR